ncbi:TVP38/TMEM64 family protein [Desulforamulus aeronauticus]|uniref:TVP38/TMEM64 family membrane protein n=1 Tax=Desulforamulus aeronauticus DSM 10349 TaxID=1121421 RepID=A0A1M6TYV5_9FIRM|nr:VTT domain-containing protein [Desulforamulus aeronauticus]SHK62205.1 Uncharacterized membrane protein YdjX, TVP38/TMEM64 family, SNARE-associated domain [Desulforamulus aeronauticus DSM 10349]
MKKFIYTIPLLIVLTILLLTGDTYTLLELVRSRDINEIANTIASYGPAAILVSLFLNTLISVLGVLPSIFLTMANTLVFGLYGGFLVSYAGELLGAVITFILYRWGITSLVKIPTEQWKLFKNIGRLPTKKQIYFLAVIRLAPFVPSGVINLLAALAGIPLLSFTIATAIGKFPALILETSFSYNLLKIGQNYLNLGISILVALLLYWGVKKEYSRIKENLK